MIVGMRRWISPRPTFTSVSRDEQTAVLNFLNRQCRLTEDGSFMGRILHRYSLLCQHVEADPPGVLMLPTRIDRVSVVCCELCSSPINPSGRMRSFDRSLWWIHDSPRGGPNPKGAAPEYYFGHFFYRKRY